MRLTHNLSSLLGRSVCLSLVLALAVIPSLAIAEAPPSRWPSGWSREVAFGRATLVYRHRTAVVGADSLWVATVNAADEGTSLHLAKVDIPTGNRVHEFSFPLTYLLNGFSVAGNQDGVALTWLERQEGVASRLWLVYVTANGQVTAPRTIWHSDRPAENPEIQFDEQGMLHIVFTSAIGGMHTVHIWSSAVANEAPPLVTRVTLPTTQARLPVLAVSDGVIHLAYYRQTLIGAWGIYQQHRSADHSLIVETNLGLAPDNYPYPIALLAAAQGRVHVIWQRMSGAAGRVSAGPAVMGTLYNGQWEAPFSIVAPGQRGRIAAVRAAESPTGEVLISWLGESDPAWQVYAVIRDAEGNLMRRGFASLAPGNVHGPVPQFVGDLGLVSFAMPRERGQGEFFYVHTGVARPEPWFFRLGLDPNNPLQDGVFKYFTLLIGAVGLAFMGLGALAVSIAVISIFDHFGVFSSSRFGIFARFLTQFVVLVGLKQPGSLLYYGAQFIPGSGALVSFALAAVVALCVLHLSGMDSEDWPALGLTGIMFMASDAFVTLAVLGVGLW